MNFAYSRTSSGSSLFLQHLVFPWGDEGPKNVRQLVLEHDYVICHECASSVTI